MGTLTRLSDFETDRDAVPPVLISATKMDAEFDQIITESNAQDVRLDAQEAAGNVSTADLADDAVDGDKIAANAVDSEHYVDGSIDNEHIADDAINSEHYAAGSIDLEHMSANSVDSDQYVDGSIDLAHMSANSVDSDQYVDGSIDSAHIGADQVITAKILDSNVTLPKIVDASATNKVLGRVASGSGNWEEVTLETTLSSTDEAIPTSKAVRDDIVSLVNDVGGFHAIADDQSFPNTNPDPDDGAGTVVSIANAGGLVVNGSGVSTTGRTLGASTVTINGIPSPYQGTTIADSLGMHVISTVTLNTYAYHKIIAKEGDTNIVSTNIANVNTVAGISSNVTTVAGISANTTTVAGISGNVTSVAAIASDITAVAADASDIGAVAADASDIGAVAAKVTEIGRLGTADAVADMALLGLPAVITDMDLLGASGVIDDIETVSDDIANVNLTGGSIANVNTVAASIADVNRYANEYTVGGSAPGSPDEGDLWYDEGSDLLNVYSAGSWSPVSSATSGITDLHQDATPQLGGFLDANGHYIQMQKGPDIASASPTVILTTGDFFICTGTTGFSAFTVDADRHFFLEFAGALVMTHVAGTLDLPSGDDITTAAGDVGEFVSTASNVVTCVNYSKASGKPVKTDFVDADINASAAIATSKLSGAVTSIASHGLATSATTDTTNASNIGSGTLPDGRFPATLPSSSGVNLTALNGTNIGSGTVPTARLGTGTADSTKFLRGDNSWQVVSIPKLDLPTITGTMSVLSGGTVTHTITNWSDDLSWTITPTNCTVGTVNGSGEFVITSTGGAPSYTIVATTDSLGLDDSNTVTKNITLQLTAPTLSSPADSYEAVNVTYTVTSTTTDDDKIILNIGSSNFTYQSVSHGVGSKVGNTVEVTGFSTNNPAIVIQFTAEATYSVTATSAKIDGSFTTSPASGADSITILNPTLSAPAISSPADVGTATNVAYTITSNDANDNKLVLNIGSSNFTYVGVSVGSGSKVGNTVECTSFSTNNPVVTIQYTAEATYSVTAAAYDTTGYYHDSANSSADSIIISNYAYGGTNFGYFCGGWNGGWPSTTNAIEKYSYTSGANATPVGTMTYTAMAIACGQSDTYGYTGGGYHAPVYRNQMGKYSFSSEGASSTVGTMVTSAGWVSGVSSETHFYVHGGGGNAEKIGKTSFASGGNLAVTYNGGNNIADGGSCTSQYYGYAAGGSSAGTNYYRYAFASDTSISVYGTMPSAKDGVDGWSSSTKGYFVGGATDDIKGFTFASGGLQADVGDLVNSNYYSATTSSTTYGYIAGQAPSYNSLIQRMSFSSEGDAVDTTYDLTKSYGYTNGFQY